MLNDFEFNRANECLNEQEKIVDKAITTINLMIFIPRRKISQNSIISTNQLSTHINI
jgi:hypothetical protein